MTSDRLEYYSQSNFKGGICDQQENLDLRKGQVLDARNVWAPLGTLVRRPATFGAPVYTVGVAANPSTLRAQFANLSLVGSTGTRTLLGAVVSSENIFVGDIITPTGYTAFNGGILNAASILAGPFSDPSAYVTRRLVTYQAYSSRGWVTIYEQGFSGIETLVQFGALLPADAQADSNGDWIRAIITGVYTGGAFISTPGTAAGNVSSAGAGYITEIYVNAQIEDVRQFFGSYFLKYATGTKIINSFTTPGNNGNFRFNVYYNYPNFFSSSYSTYQTGDTYGGQVANPLSLTVIPEFNTAYLAVQNQVTEIPLTGAPRVAVVNSDPAIVGPTTGLIPAEFPPYPSDVIAQSPVFPAANYIINFRNLIFAAGIKDSPTLIQWSGAVNEGAYNVWPETSFENLSTASDNSPITGLAGLGDNLVVFKQNSIWLMVYDGLDDLELPKFIPQLVVAGVGCLAANSIQQVNGRLMFLAEDGFYAFDGTPNIKKMSETVNSTVQRINPANKPFATAINWRSRYAYMCAVALDESDTNNVVFVYDYKHQSWWIWDGWDINCWFQVDGVGLMEDVYFVDSQSNGYQLERGDTDNGDPIDNYILTTRFGRDEVMWKSARDVRIRGQNIDGTLPYFLYSDDRQLGVTSKNAIMESQLETQADPAPPDGCDNVEIRGRERKMPQRLLGEWFQLKVEDFRLLEGINIGYLPESRR